MNSEGKTVHEWKFEEANKLINGNTEVPQGYSIINVLGSTRFAKT